jgi:hypothetical protein
MWPIAREPGVKVAYSAWSGFLDLRKNKRLRATFGSSTQTGGAVTLNWPHSRLLLQPDTLNWPHAKTGKGLLLKPTNGYPLPRAE